MSFKRVKLVALLTVVMSIPLLLSLIVKSSGEKRRILLRWNLAEIIVAIVAEIIFVTARYSPP